MNPVYVRGIKSRMRGLRAPILISIFLIIISGIFALVYLSSAGTGGYSYYGYGGTARPAPIGVDMVGEFYIMLTVILFAVIALMVPAMNAGVIASEREKQTLDLLLCTPMSARKIITGKLLSNLTFVAFLLVLVMPVFAILYLFGSLSIWTILKLLLFMMISAYACASVAVFFSGLFKRTSIATILSYVALLLFVVLTLIIGALIYTRFMMSVSSTGMESYIPFLWKINPVYALIEMASQDLSTLSSGSSYYGGYSIISMLTGGYYGGYYGTEEVAANSVYYSSALMIGVSVLLNIFSAIFIKPIKKLQIK